MIPFFTLALLGVGVRGVALQRGPHIVPGERQTVDVNAGCATPPKPEPIYVHELPFPPIAPSSAVGSCNASINPHHTGCVDLHTEPYSGNFMPDGNHVLVTVNFTGAPALPAPGSIYTGQQLIIVSTTGAPFSNGDLYKCITCGVPPAQRAGIGSLDFYPQAFHDGVRAVVGNNIVTCGANFATDACTPNNTHIYPIRLSATANNSGPGLTLRELRLHPDNVHLGFNAFTPTFGEVNGLSRLVFNSNPTTGTPLSPRYDLENVTLFQNENLPQSVYVQGSNIYHNASAISVGEFRGFTGQGTEAYYVGATAESDNIDVFAVGLSNGVVRRITEYPGYCDPIDSSADGEWQVILDTRFTNRTDFMDGMRWIPPMTDLVTAAIASSVRNNGNRRFFNPWLLNKHGDCGTYYGQQINAVGNGKYPDVGDPSWNALADPRWSLDQTKIVYHEGLVVAPACGGSNPLPCPVSTEPHGRIYRVMMAQLTSRKPVAFKQIAPISDVVPWGTPYVPGAAFPGYTTPPAGNYTLQGYAGYANVSLIANARGGLGTVQVAYHNYSVNGLNYLNGMESTTVTAGGQTSETVNWFSNITSQGYYTGSKVTSAPPSNFFLEENFLANYFEANGTLTTTVNGATYRQPVNNG